MICESTVKRFCCEDISLIENYKKAINDNTQTWELHHRLESDENLSVKELKSMGMYFHRPANELILLTPFEHKSLHHKGKTPWNKGIPSSEETRKKQSESHKDKHWKLSEETKAKMRKPKSEETKHKISESLKNKPRSEETRKKISESQKGKPKPWKSHPLSDETRKKIGIKSLGNKANTGYKWVHNNKERKMVKPDELEYYLNKGYNLGMK